MGEGWELKPSKMGNPSELAPCRSRTGRRLSAVSPEEGQADPVPLYPHLQNGVILPEPAFNGRLVCSHSPKLFRCLKD